ncbi:oxidoreductase [Gemmatimonadetes bacterium T265]|nr:oxidoreductase [Gemmatimonadetes bacterium T265]
MPLTNRTVLITGGASGIGLALATLLVPRRNTVLVTGRDGERLAAAERALPGVRGFQSDASDPEAIRALRERVLAEFPALDVLVNNAGVMRNIDFGRAAGPDDVTREIEINLSGPVRMVEQFLPHLKGRGEALIVNVSSGLAFVPFPLAPVYSATKAGIHAFTQVLRVQLAGTGVTVVELAPPGVETPLFRGEFTEAVKGQKAMDPAVLAARAVAGIEAGRLEIRPGLSNVVKLLSRAAPGFALRQLTRTVLPKREGA